jgi:hypothetical protein
MLDAEHLDHNRLKFDSDVGVKLRTKIFADLVQENTTSFLGENVAFV